jgi:hypothetical protein
LADSIKKAPGQSAPGLGQQINMLMRVVAETPGVRDSVTYKEIINFVKAVPVASRPPELLSALMRAYTMTAHELGVALDSIQPRKQDFDSLLPDRGWLRDYIEYTNTTEPPTVFHFFTGLVAMGSALGRNVSFNLGFGHIFPNMCVILVAPSGKCRKTSCCELGVKLYRGVGGTILADKITPEALVGAFEEKTSATGLIYAGELAQFLGKQKYQEGMIPLLTRLFDCPDVWSSATITRKELTLKNVAFSMLGASTMDWLRTGIPSDSFGGGFMSRFLFIIQETTPRSFPRPPGLREDLKMKLLSRLMELTHLRGNFSMTPAAGKWYDEWYNAQSLQPSEEKQFSGYYERKPAHLLRMSMLLTLAVSDAMILEKATLQQSLTILDWVESWLPGAFEALSTTSAGEDAARCLRILKRHNGEMEHSPLMRRFSGRMNARQFKDLINTLRESKLIDYEPVKRVYFLTPEGWLH